MIRISSQPSRRSVRSASKVRDVSICFAPGMHLHLIDTFPDSLLHKRQRFNWASDLGRLIW